RRRSEKRQRIPMHGADQAVQAVEPETCAPVEVRLDCVEDEGARNEERDRLHEHPRRANRLRHRTAEEEMPLAHGERGEPHDCPRNRKRGREGATGENAEPRPADGLLEPQPDERRPRRELVRERPGREDDERARTGPDENPSSHRTFNVNGAVSTFPRTLNWRKSRHVPGCGNRTPTLSLPGAAEWPPMRVFPKMPAHAGVFAPHTCVWK